MIKVFTVAEMVAAEKAADASGVTSYPQMMETAGKAVAEAIRERYPVAGMSILALVGPGNNGGDGLVAGRYLAEAGADVAFYLYKIRDAAQDENYAKIMKMDLFAIEASLDQGYRTLRDRLAAADLVLDALLGTGVTRPIGGELAHLMQQVWAGINGRSAQRPNRVTLNRFSAAAPPAEAPPIIVAVDCPSGLNCDSGALDELALPASLTVTFAGAKRGHFRFPGAAACGELVVADIGIPADLPDVAQVQVAVMTAADARERQPKRPLSGHKGTFGTAVIAAGSTHYWGAPILAAKAAYRVGAGLVALAVPTTIRAACATQLPEATYPLIPDSQILGPASVSVLQATKGDALLIGPGLDAADAFITDLLAAKETLPPLVIDADGLNVLASKEAWWKRLPPHTILTPHPGEMARLMGVTLADLQERDRVALAQEKAAAWGCVLLLKGAYTVIAAPDGRLTINPFANPALAVAGSGDVLSGVITGLLAQGVAPFDAARLGAYLHGAAAAQYAYDSGLLMRELCDFLPEVMAREK